MYNSGMRLRLVLFIFVTALLATSCSKGEQSRRPRANPISVRGWVSEIGDPASPARSDSQKVRLFRETSIYVEEVEFAFGGIAETGAFVFLDVPPGLSHLVFSYPGFEATLKLEGIPNNADVYLPHLALRGAKIELLDMNNSRIRVEAPNKGSARNTGKTGLVAGVPVPIWEVPLSDLEDRREYPRAPIGNALPMLK